MPARGVRAGDCGAAVAVGLGEVVVSAERAGTSIGSFSQAQPVSKSAVSSSAVYSMSFFMRPSFPVSIYDNTAGGK